MNESPAGAGRRDPVLPAPKSNPWQRTNPEGSRRSTLLRVDKSHRLASAFSLHLDTSPSRVNSTSSRASPSTRSLSYSADRRRPGPSGFSEVGSGRPRPPGSAATFRSEQPGPRRRRQRRRARGRPAGSGGLPPTRKADRTRDDHREDRPDGCGAVRCGWRRSAVLHLTFVRTTQERPTPPRTPRTVPVGCSQ